MAQRLKSNFLIIAFSQDLYKFHYALSMASSLKAVNKKSTVFISGYACNYIRKNWQQYDSYKINDKFKKKKMASINELFLYCQELGVKIYFCQTALDFLNINENDINNLIAFKPIGLYSILNTHKEEQILFI